MKLDPLDVNELIANMTPEQMADMVAMLDELEDRKRVTLAQTDFLAFIAMIDRTYKFGTHLKRLGALLMDVEVGAQDRVAVSMAPRFGKSQMISIYYPAWYLGKHPDHKVIVASHTADLAIDMARKVRNLMQTAEYRAVFPGVSIAGDAKAAGKWNTNKGGEYYAVGVGGALAGRGGHLIITDDPLSEQDIKNSNFTSLDTTYEWFRSGLRTRLMPEGKIVILHCLTGDTRVMLADGGEALLRDIRPGALVASYDAGTFRPAKVLGWANQGLDQVYSVALKSGVIIRGNERHPLLVETNGVQQWVTIKNLKPGMNLVSARGARIRPIAKSYAGSVSPATTKSTKLSAPQGGLLSRLFAAITPAQLKAAPASGGLSLNRAPATPVTPERTTTRKTQTRRVSRSGTTADGKESSATPMGVANLCTPKGFASPVTTKLSTPPANPKVLTIAQQSEATPISKCAMGSLALSTIDGSLSKAACAPFAQSLRMKEIPRTSGKFAGWLLTIATTLASYGRSCATHAISWSKTGTPLTCCEKPLSTLSTTLDEIQAITPDGVEDVFDIQVEGTENFLANGVVSHNTRWHQRDLIGRLLKDSALNEGGDKYSMFEFPAILNEGSPEEKSLWPEQWSLESLQRTKASMPLWQWNAQYMQDPTAADSAIIKREWIKWWPHENPPAIDYIIQSWDTALTTKERSDWSVCHTWGIFTREDDKTANAILLNSAKGKWEFPELKRTAFEQYEEWSPDSVIVEAKASGQPLIDEMRRSGIFVQDFSPGKGQDKIARLNAVADMFSAGHVWFPETAWAQAVVEEIIAFPAGEHDDEVDACTLALRRARNGGLLRLSTDRDDNQEFFSAPRRAAYY